MANPTLSRLLSRRSALLVGALLLGLAAAPSAALAQQAAYPSKPIKLVIPYPPGGGTDITGRAMAQRLAEFLGQSVVIENKPGATGMIGAASVAKSTPDGYTVLITNDNAASAPHIMNLSYDYTKQLQPVCYLGRQSQFLAVHSSMGSIR